MAKITEQILLKNYLSSDSSEKSRQHLLYPVFQILFKEKFKIENDAKGADVYVEGRLIVESKTSHSQWLEGFYQALHFMCRQLLPTDAYRPFYFFPFFVGAGGGTLGVHSAMDFSFSLM
jgi:hypothetical protein